MSERGRKPIPKTQRELSQEQIQPYDDRGNPNVGEGIVEIKGGETFIDRANSLTFRGDDTKQYHIGLTDIDTSILYYFNEIIKPNVIQNDKLMQVPLIYGNPEKWNAVQKEGFLRDKKGKIMAPIIMFRRTNVDKVRSLSSKIDALHPQNFHIFSSKYNQKNAYDNFEVLNNRKPQKTYNAVIVPDWVEIKYECIIFTYYVEQMNKIVEAINFASDSYWGNPERFKFKSTINSFSQVIEVVDGDDRSVKSTFTINLYGYIIPDSINKTLATTKIKYNDKSKVVTFTEVVSNINDINSQENLQLFLNTTASNVI